MPFTLAHPAVVVFSKNKYLNLCALILGTMAPDYIYFILFNPSSNIGHTISGFILLNVPLCFLLNYLFYNYIQEPLIVNLPNCISKNYLYLIKNKNKIINIKQGIIFAYSSIIGMFTHVFWDSFTHKTGYFVVNIEFLRHKINLLGYNIPLYKIAQHGSTLVGFIIITIYLYVIRDKNAKEVNFKNNKTLFYLIIFIIQLLTIVFSYLYFKNSGFGIGRLVVTTINGLFLGYLGSGIYYKIRI